MIFNSGLLLTHYNCICILVLSHQLEYDHMNGWNMLVIKK